MMGSRDQCNNLSFACTSPCVFVAATDAPYGVEVVAGATVVIQAVADLDIQKREDFASARANSVLFQRMEAKDVMTTMMLPTPKATWGKLSKDCAAVLASTASLARSSFNDFRMHDGDTMI